MKAALARLADDQLRTRTEQGNMSGLGRQQAFGQGAPGLLVVADHRTDMCRRQRSVHRHHRQAGGDDGGIQRVVGGQATGDDQRLAATRAKQLQQLPLGVGIIVGTGDQQLVTRCTGLLFQQLGQACITGVFQVRQDEAQAAALPAAQAGGLLVGAIAVFFHHGQHTRHGRRADAPTFGLTVDHVAGSGYRDLGQAGDVAEFHGRSTM